MTLTGTEFEPLLVPVKATVWVLPAEPSALSVIVKTPFTVPAAEGLKVTLTVQLAPPATLDPQVLVSAKLAGNVVTAILVTASATLEVLVTVTG